MPIRLFAFVATLNWFLFGPALYGETLETSEATARLRVIIDTEAPQQVFAAGKLLEAFDAVSRRAELVDSHSSSGGGDVEVLIDTSLSGLENEGFNLQTKAGKVRVIAKDQTGAMYGLLELAEQVSLNNGFTGIRDTLQNPHFSFRAIKFNLPWSAYRQYEAITINHEACRDLEMWEAFLDMMAENRFNSLTLWNLHPFPYLVRAKNFPKACSFTDEELSEWKAFWRTLFRMAKDRGIETYLVNWNIFVSEGFNKHYERGNVDGARYRGDAKDSPVIRKYLRESITQVINEYPDLTGLGVTLGEGMEDWDSEAQTEWVRDVFFNGIEAADRDIKFIYRAALKGDHEPHRNAIDESGLDRPDSPIIVELKFNWSHGHSTPTLVMAHGGGTGEEYWTNPAPSHHKMAWMVRNEDFFRLRWGEPDFIREHIGTNDQEFVGGYFVGSECYIPAKDIFYIPDHPHVSWDWAFERQWLFYMVWGRLLYNPELSNDVFSNAFNVRYNGNHGDSLCEAFNLSSRTAKRIAGYLSWSWDFTLYTEGFLKAKNLYPIRKMLEDDPIEPKFVSIKEFGDGTREFGDLVTPLQLADLIDKENTRAMELVEAIETDNKTLKSEIEDVKAWCALGFYFSCKLRAAVALNQKDYSTALTQMDQAVKHWEELVKNTEVRFQEGPLTHMRRGTFHWKNYLEAVRQERNWVRGQGGQ